MLQSENLFQLGTPTLEQRHAFFSDISSTLALPPSPEALAAAAGEGGAAASEPPPPALPKDPAAEAAEKAAKEEAEESAARQRCVVLSHAALDLVLCSRHKLSHQYSLPLHLGGW